jgi:hypothetical protein
VILGLAACGGGGTSTIRGQVEPGGGPISGGLETNYGFCTEDSPGPGAQITVTDPSGKVIGTGTLGLWSHRTATASGLTMYPCLMSFTIKAVPAESRYGFEINNVPGKIWVTNVSKLVTLEVGSG